jgi:hypothetical protein
MAEQLLSDSLSVQSHGDYHGGSVGVVIPRSTRQLLGIDAETELVVRSWGDRVRIAKPSVEMPDALHAKRVTPVQLSTTIQVSIPATARDILGIEQGDQLRYRTFNTHIELQPIEDALDLEER